MRCSPKFPMLLWCLWRRFAYRTEKKDEVYAKISKENQNQAVNDIQWKTEAAHDIIVSLLKHSILVSAWYVFFNFW
jgi:hypothetical protein